MNDKKKRSYEEVRSASAARSREFSQTVREIGPLPGVADPARRAVCAGSFERFCKVYEAAVFELSWSKDHLRVIEKIEAAVRDGGQYAMAMPRGSGKTCLCIAAATWALLYGYHKFVLLVGATETAADEMLQSLRHDLSENELLLQDFPEVCFPIFKLEGIPHRCGGQTLDGKRTKLSWTHKEMVLPTVPGSAASGSVVRTAGIDGRIRGHQKRTGGGVVRPSLVIVDDPQTRESARSRGEGSQSAQREKILAGDVLYAGKPKTKIAALMPCTVIYRGDMADNILDQAKHPEWQGERTKFLYSFPKESTRWDYYSELRADGLRAGVGLAWATAYYEVYRAAMDDGAAVSWPERFSPDELSAVQHAMNAFQKDRAAFMAEYQNEPTEENEEAAAVLADQYLSSRCLPEVARGVAPTWADAAFATIDIGQYRLHWEASAWALGSDSSVLLDCGVIDTDVDRGGALREVKDARRRASLVERGITGALETLRERLGGFQKIGSTAVLTPRFGVDVGGTAGGTADDDGAAWAAAVIAFCRTAGQLWLPLKGARWTDGHRRRAGERNYAWSERGFFETNSNHYKTLLFESYQRPLASKDGSMAARTRGFFGALKEVCGEYLKHQRSERPDARGQWERWNEKQGARKSGLPNHWWDCAYMQFVMADIARGTPDGAAARVESFVPEIVESERRDTLMM